MPDFIAIASAIEADPAALSIVIAVPVLITLFLLLFLVLTPRKRRTAQAADPPPETIEMAPPRVPDDAPALSVLCWEPLETAEPPPPDVSARPARSGEQIYWATVAEHPEVFPEHYTRASAWPREQIFWQQVADDPEQHPQYYRAGRGASSTKRPIGRPRTKPPAEVSAAPGGVRQPKPPKPAVKMPVAAAESHDPWDDETPLKHLTRHTVPVLGALRYPLEIRYRDSAGRETERPIVAMKLMGEAQPDGRVVPTQLIAFCEKRNGVRAFLLPRILEAIDGETGEVLADLTARLTEVAAENSGRAPAKGKAAP